MTLANNNTTINQSKKFGLWIGLGSITMMFIALTSAYIVRRSAGNWVDFRLPNMFFISTIVILFSSMALELSYRSFMIGKEKVYRLWLMITLILGLLFCVTQYFGWQQLYDIGVPLNGNPSGSFIYAISGLHVAHVVGGIMALTVAVYHSVSLPYFVSDERQTRFKLVVQYWHYVDILWIYLLLFFLIFR
jgi:cytochrome c oxidase subunit 3